MSEPKDNKPNLSRKEWLEGLSELSREDKQALKQRLSEQPFEKKALRGRTNITDKTDAEALLTGLDKAIEARYGLQGKKMQETKLRLLNKWWSIAAGFLILLAIGWWLWPKTTNTESIYATYFSPYPNDLTITPMGDSGSSGTLDEVMRPYNTGNYEEAAKRMQNYLEAETELEAVWLYYGICLMQIGDLEEAKAVLSTSKELPLAPHYNEAISWYLGLTYLKGQQINDAKAIFMDIAASESHFQEQAKTLLKKLP